VLSKSSNIAAHPRFELVPVPREAARSEIDQARLGFFESS
jgi:hypothetical protein